jgi:peptide/nickel transport system substrate-binding protein
MKFGRTSRHALTIGAVVSALVLGLLTTSVSGASSAASTITFAEGPGASPNWIFPYTGFLYDNVANINQFQQLMYRPLYFFGEGANATYDPSISLANKPVMSDSDHIVTINLKGWRFADGQVVNAQSVMFFLNLYKADPEGYGGYEPGAGIPDQVASASGSGNRVIIHMKTAVNANWILYNYLSEITPLPNSWDVTGPHTPGRCATGAYGAASTDSSCKSVETYLDSMSTKTSTYVTSFWQGGDDGPWKLTSFDSLGDATFQANTKYSGPQKAQVKYVKEVAYTSASAEESDLQAGKIDLGYIDPSLLTSPAPAPGKVGANLTTLNSKYRLSSSATYSFNYASINFSSVNPLQAEFNQLYFREALQKSIDQASVIKSVDQNYGVLGYSPLPPNTPTTISKTPTNSYAYNATDAKTLLTSHGWTEANGVMSCANPGSGASECGANIAKGATLSFTFLYLTGSPSIDATVNQMVSDWASIGIDVTATANTFDDLQTACAATSTTAWSVCWWGGGLAYDPHFYPSGDELFQTGALANVGSYSNVEMDSLIKADMASTSTLSTYEQYAANQLPVLYLPNSEATYETIRTLKNSIGWTPNVLQNFLPEYLSF